MDDRELKAQLSNLIRARIEPGLSNATPALTDEQKRARLELTPPDIRKMIEENGWPVQHEVSETAKEAYVSSQVDHLIGIVKKHREATRTTGPVSEEELDDAIRERPSTASEYMLFRLNAQPPHPMRQAFAEMLEQSQRDIEVLRNSPSEEQIKEIGDRASASMLGLDPEDFFERAKKLLKESEDDEE